MSPPATGQKHEFVKALTLTDATMLVAGSMIGSGVFIVAADMGRTLGSPGWLLIAWVLTGVITVLGALAYGELAAIVPVWITTKSVQPYRKPISGLIDSRRKTYM